MKAADETTTALSECPPEWPDQNSACMNGLYCPYGMEECCGEMIPDAVFECYDGHWSIMIIDSLCDFGRKRWKAFQIIKRNSGRFAGLPCPDDSTTVEV